jgi:aerobic carbon-monoxide dehydrogenase large subunit
VVINPLSIQGQAIGSVVQGLGGALLENLAYDDFPNVRGKVVELFPSPSNPLAAKGGGEGGNIPTGGMIANAVASAQ